MNTSAPSFNEYFNNKWQLLGELRLTRGLDIEATVYVWLLEVLKPLDVHIDFFNRLVQSVQDAVVNLLDAGSVSQKFDHVHLLMFARTRQMETPRSWGFFHIEKLEELAHENNPPDHAVKFYLYPE